jgi:multidrug resistance efflux pump
MKGKPSATTKTLRKLSVSQLKAALSRREAQIRKWNAKKKAAQARLERLEAKVAGLSGR